VAFKNRLVEVRQCGENPHAAPRPVATAAARMFSHRRCSLAKADKLYALSCRLLLCLPWPSLNPEPLCRPGGPPSWQTDPAIPDILHCQVLLC
jgi:hypothetical protein